MNKLLIYTDGGSRGNPGQSAVAFLAYLQNTEVKKIFQYGKKIGIATNNVAEYTAVIEALVWLSSNYKKFENPDIVFFLDSNLVVNQLSGRFKIKDQKLINLLFEVRGLEKNFPQNIKYYFIPREKNKKADMIVNQVLDGRYKQVE